MHSKKPGMVVQGSGLAQDLLLTAQSLPLSFRVHGLGFGLALLDLLCTARSLPLSLRVHGLRV